MAGLGRIGLVVGGGEDDFWSPLEGIISGRKEAACADPGLPGGFSREEQVDLCD